MKKILLALPLVAGVSWAGTTYYSGAQTEAAYDRMIAQLNANAGGKFVLKSTEYNAGIMESTAVTEFRATEASDIDMHFFLNHKINHSLVSVAPENPRFGAASIITTLKVDESYPEDIKQILKSFDTGEPFVATTEVSVDGATNSELKINALDHTEGDTNIKSSGSVINVVTSANGDVTGDGKAESFVFSESTNKQANMSNLDIKFDMKKLKSDEKISPYFYDLDFILNVDESKFIEDGAQIALIEGIKYVITQDISSDEPSGFFSVGVDNMEVDSIPLNSWNLETAMTGFSVTEMLSNQTFVEELQASANPVEVLFSEKGIEMMRATFKPDTKMAIKLDANSSEGDGIAEVDLWFTGNGSDDGYTGMATTGDLAKAFAGTAVVDVDKSAVMMTPLGSMLEHPMAQAYLTVTEDKVSLNANLDKLVLKLNEQVLPLELMAGEMLNMPLESLLDQL